MNKKAKTITNKLQSPGTESEPHPLLCQRPSLSWLPHRSETWCLLLRHSLQWGGGGGGGDAFLYLAYLFVFILLFIGLFVQAINACFLLAFCFFVQAMNFAYFSNLIYLCVQAKLAYFSNLIYLFVQTINLLIFLTLFICLNKL